MAHKNTYTQTALRVLARELVDQMAYDAYPNEWSRPPLSKLVPLLCLLLNKVHDAKLGDIIHEAYDHTFPKPTRWNINQLGEMHPSYFGTTKQRFLDEYETIEHIPGFGFLSSAKKDIDAELLRETARQIMVTLCSLQPHQDNAHRTLFAIIKKLFFVLAPFSETYHIAQDIGEYKDYFLQMSPKERLVYANKLMNGWKSPGTSFKPISSDEVKQA